MIGSTCCALPLAAVGVAVIVCSGCVSVSRSYPEKHHYALEVVRQGETIDPVSQTGLKIRKFRASSAFEGKEFVYRTSDTRYEVDFYNEWMVSPTTMLTEQVVTWLTKADLFHYVMESSGELEAQYILDGTITAMYGDYRATPSKAVLGLQVFLIHEAASQDEILWHQEYRQGVDVEGQTPDALVSAWNAALRMILMALEADLNRVLKRTAFNGVLDTSPNTR